MKLCYKIRDKRLLIYLLVLLTAILVITFNLSSSKTPFQKNTGPIFGTFYTIVYQYDEDLQENIESLLLDVDNSLSVFNKNSIISKINRNEKVELSKAFKEVFVLANEISRQTDGYFDITVAPLVNAWGFGFKNADKVDATLIDSVMDFVGYQKVKLHDNQIIKEDSRLMLDCGSIAKGYGVDVVARLLDEKGIKNYMVEIGGEIVVKGNNHENSTWRIGIRKPTDDKEGLNMEVQNTIEISNVGVATSGNYYRFYYKDGKRYAHIINPKNGYPVEHSLLSATVVAKDCATADAYATAFMAMGLDAAIEICKYNNNIDAFFVYDGNGNNYETYATPRLEKYITD